MKFKFREVCGITWTCKRCGAVFTTEAQWAMHILMCGSHHPGTRRDAIEW